MEARRQVETADPEAKRSQLKKKKKKNGWGGSALVNRLKKERKILRKDPGKKNRINLRVGADLGKTAARRRPALQT